MNLKPLVIVEWLDANATQLSSFEEHEIPHAPMTAQTLGWLLRDDEKGVSVAGEFFETDKTWRSVTFVPRGMVVRVRSVGRSPRGSRASARTSDTKSNTEPR